MIIRADLCIKCVNCVILCTFNAIIVINDKVLINQDFSVECSVCYRYADYPINAITPKRLK